MRSNGIEVRGFLRHRSFLADVARPGAGGYQQLLAETVRPGMTVIDGGAHIGIYTLIAARAAGPTGCVLACEPDPYNLAALRANVRLARATTVEVIPKAIADRAGRTSFVQSRGTISGSITDRTDVGPSRLLDVELTSVDEALPVAPASLLVKLNVEGAERLVLAGMQRTLTECPEIVLFVELNPAALRAAGSDPAALVGLLEGLGFTLQAIDPVDESCARSRNSARATSSAAVVARPAPAPPRARPRCGRRRGGTPTRPAQAIRPPRPPGRRRPTGGAARPRRAAVGRPRSPGSPGCPSVESP